MNNRTPLEWIGIGHGIFYFTTGVWPLLHMESFIWISGPKYDLWLVETVGIILMIVGLVLLSAGINRRINEETFLLAVGCATGLTVVDLYYTAIGRIWNIYMLDAVVECILIVLWFIYFRREKGMHLNTER